MKMSQVLARGLHILQRIARMPTEPTGLSAIAGELGLHPATCARILKTLVEEGFVEQIGPKKGYILGPAAYTLGANGPYRRDVALAAEPLLIELAREVEETLVLAGLSHGRWVTLCEVDGQQSIQVRPEVVSSHDTPYTTATGRVCLAFLSEDELAAVLARYGLPTEERWPGSTTRESLDAARARIRSEAFAFRRSDGTMALAVPVLEEGRAVAALGSYLPHFRYKGAHKKRLIAGLRRTAQAIAERVQAGVA